MIPGHSRIKLETNVFLMMLRQLPKCLEIQRRGPKAPMRQEREYNDDQETIWTKRLC